MIQSVKENLIEPQISEVSEIRICCIINDLIMKKYGSLGLYVSSNKHDLTDFYCWVLLKVDCEDLRFEYFQSA